MPPTRAPAKPPPAKPSPAKPAPAPAARKVSAVASPVQRDRPVAVAAVAGGAGGGRDGAGRIVRTRSQEERKRAAVAVREQREAQAAAAKDHAQLQAVNRDISDEEAALRRKVPPARPPVAAAAADGSSAGRAPRRRNTMRGLRPLGSSGLPGRAARPRTSLVCRAGPRRIGRSIGRSPPRRLLAGGPAGGRRPAGHRRGTTAAALATRQLPVRPCPFRAVRLLDRRPLFCGAASLRHGHIRCLTVSCRCTDRVSGGGDRPADPGRAAAAARYARQHGLPLLHIEKPKRR